MVKRFNSVKTDVKMMLYYHDYNNIFDIIKCIIIWAFENTKKRFENKGGK